MATFVYPSSDLDRPYNLLALLGSFWSSTFQDNNLVLDILQSRARLSAQVHSDFLDLVKAVSRENIEVLHKENWHYLTFAQSGVNNSDSSIPTFETLTSHVFDNLTELRYGQPQQTTGYAVECPVSLKDCPLIVNRVTDPSLVLIQGIDFWIEKPGVLVFREDPFANPLVAVQELFENHEVIDRQAGLWLYHSGFDWDTIYEQFGYAIKLRMPSSPGYKELVNAVLESLISGTTANDIHAAWSAITGVPLVKTDGEVVELITKDSRSLVIATDKHVYRFVKDATAIVQVGDILSIGDALTDVLRIYEFNHGGTPPAELSAVTAGNGILSPGEGFLGELVFENKTVPLVVEADPDGVTKVSFEIGGYPGDVEHFWDVVHERGKAAGTTLAQMLDIRISPMDQPLAGSLPTSINPLQFLLENLLRYHAFVVRIKTGYLGRDALGLWSATALRRIVPPETLMVTIVELEVADEPVIMEGAGSATAPGYEEAVSGFPCMVNSDTINGTDVIENVRAYQIKGRCE